MTLPLEPPRRRRRTPPRDIESTLLTLGVGWAVLLGLVVGWGWLLTHQLHRDIDPWDNDVSRWFADHRAGALDPVASFGTLLGETPIGVLVAVVAALAFALRRRSWRPVFFVVLLEAGIGGIYAIATRVDPRPRPPVQILDSGLVADHSFPSGHVATAVVAYAGIVVLTTVYAGSRRAVAPFLVLPVLVLLARLYQGAHHLTDVLTSVVYASAWLLVCARVVLAPDPRRDDVP